MKHSSSVKSVLVSPTDLLLMPDHSDHLISTHITEQGTTQEALRLVREKRLGYFPGRRNPLDNKANSALLEHKIENKFPQRGAR